MAEEFTIALVAFLLIGLLIASCGESQKEEIKKEQEKAQNSAQVNPVPACCQNHDHHQSHHSGTASLAPASPLLPTVTSPSTTTTTAKSMGIRLEAAPPVTVIDMPSPILPVYQEFSKHPRPNVSMTIPDSER